MTFSSPTERHSFSLSNEPSLGVRFVPEHVTPLSYTPIYVDLTERQKIRYNQLFGLYINELLVVFETSFSQAYAALQKKSFLSDEMRDEVRQFVADEDRHWRMFARLNSQAAPELYSKAPLHFVKAPWIASKAINILTRYPEYLPILILLIFMNEERVLYYANCYEHDEHVVDSRFAAVHRKHIEDEERHIKLDEKVLTLLWGRLSAPLRRINAFLLGVCIREFFTLPKRAGVRILNRFIEEFPELASKRNLIQEQIFDAVRHSRFYSTLYSKEVLPGSVRFLSKHPEFASLADVLPEILQSEEEVR